MINALIQNGDQTAVLNLPSNPFSLLYDLSQIGIHSRLRDIPINDDEDSTIQVKLFADSDIGSSLAVLFKPSHSLEDANLCAHMVENARPEILEELEQHIVYGQYFSPQAVMEDIKAMTEELISVTVNYYCPLQIHMTDEEYGDWYEAGNGYGICSHRITDLRRMRNTVPQMHMDSRRSEEDRMALHQPPRLRQEILPPITYNGRSVLTGCDHGNHSENGKSESRNTANTQNAHSNGIRL